KNSAVPVGTVTERVMGGVAPSPDVPVRNHTLPDCPTAAKAPLESNSGFEEAATATVHSSHSAVAPPYPLPNALEFVGSGPLSAWARLVVTASNSATAADVVRH